MWLLDPTISAQQRSQRLQDLKSIIGVSYGQEAAAASTLWIQSATATQLQNIMPTLRIALKDEKDIQEFRDEISKKYRAQAEQAKDMKEQLLTWMRQTGNFDQAKLMIKTWFGRL